MTPGREVAGTVDAVGDGVDERWLGRPVVAHLGMASGGYAEQAIVPVDALIELRDGTDPTAAVAMVGTGRTALAVLEEAAVTADDVVVVTGAAGGLGALLVQAAHAAGARVVGLAGGDEKLALVRSLGADLAVDYRRDGLAGAGRRRPRRPPRQRAARRRRRRRRPGGLRARPSRRPGRAVRLHVGHAAAARRRRPVRPRRRRHRRHRAAHLRPPGRHPGAGRSRPSPRSRPAG